jgi:hypothetical protein
MAKMKEASDDVVNKFSMLHNMADETRLDLTATKTHLAKVEKTDKEGHDSHTKTIEKLTDSTQERFEDVERELNDLKTRDIELDEEDKRIWTEHLTFKEWTEVETKRIETTAEERRKATEIETNQKMKEGFDHAAARLAATKQELDTTIKTLRADLEAEDARIDKWAHEANDTTNQKFDEAIAEVHVKVDAGFKQCNEDLDELSDDPIILLNSSRSSLHCLNPASTFTCTSAMASSNFWFVVSFASCAHLSILASSASRSARKVLIVVSNSCFVAAKRAAA